MAKDIDKFFNEDVQVLEVKVKPLFGLVPEGHRKEFIDMLIGILAKVEGILSVAPVSIFDPDVKKSVTDFIKQTDKTYKDLYKHLLPKWTAKISEEEKAKIKEKVAEFRERENV